MKKYIRFQIIIILCVGLSTAKAQTTFPDPNYTPLIESWWIIFNDPLLDSLEEIGLHHNLDLQVMVARVDEARERIKVAQSYQYPSVQINPFFASQSLSPNRPTALALQEGQVLNRHSLETYQIPLDVSYEVDLWQRIKNQVKESTQIKEATEAELQAAALTTSSEIARLYYLLRTIDTEQAVVQKGISLRDSTLDIAEARYAAGLVNQMDVQRAETEVGNARVQLEELNRSRREVELSLAILLGISPTDLNIARGKLPTLLPIVSAISETDLLLNRPDLKQSERMTASANSRVDMVKAARLPRLNLLGSAGLISRGVNQMLSANSGTYLVGARISMPIFEGFRNKSNIAIAEKQVQIAESTFQQRYLLAIQEVELAVSNLEILSRQALVQQQALQSAQKTRLYARELYVKGLTSFLEAIDAERTALDLERQAVNFKGQQLIYTIALIKAMGGNR
jgi:multidrug efflux system outer membrane protein